MKTCPYCAYQNREGILFCEECGHPFVGDQEAVMVTTQLMQRDQNNSQKTAGWGTAHFNPGAQLIVRIRDQADMVMLEPREEVLIGRSDVHSGQSPDLDLGPYGGAEQGVSRRHAIIVRGDNTLTLVDLESINGTYLNGQRLIPSQPRVLRDGDEIRLGRMVIHLFFK